MRRNANCILRQTLAVLKTLTGTSISKTSRTKANCVFTKRLSQHSVYLEFGLMVKGKANLILK